jgi:heat-inducible transcriptional repressor
MDQRKKLILNTIIKEHIKTGAPVGSGVLVDKYKLKVSPATVRNEMAELEDEGFIIQPYTSAGRIPTEKAYKMYLAGLKAKSLGRAEAAMFNKLLANKDELSFKDTAKAMARLSGNAVFWAFYRHNLYYTGISNLLKQPEFSHPDLIYDISLIIDRVDEIIDNIFDDVKHSPYILLGSDNPFGNFCGTVLTKYKADGKTGMFGILGPMRMDYEKNLALVDFISKKISTAL